MRWGGLIAQELGARLVVNHLGLYGNVEKKEALRRIAENLKAVSDWWRLRKLKPLLGIETSGRQEVAGTLSEILALCKKVRGVVPVLNFAHVHSREGGILRRPEDFKAVLEQAVKASSDRHLHVQFSGVEHQGGNELRYTPIKRGDLRFEPMAEALLGGSYDMSLISSSPLLEHDAMYMKVILERMMAKTVQKTTRFKPPKEIIPPKKKRPAEVRPKKLVRKKVAPKPKAKKVKKPKRAPAKRVQKSKAPKKLPKKQVKAKKKVIHRPKPKGKKPQKTKRKAFAKKGRKRR